MRHLILAALLITGCAEKTPQKPHYRVKSSTYADAWGESLGGLGSVETSLITISGRVMALHDPATDGGLYVSDLGTDGRSFNGVIRSATDMRFSYVMPYAGLFYLFALRAADIYLWSSNDLYAWKQVNGGRPVLTHAYGLELWNVGVDVDSNGVWHLLVEASATGNANAGLIYSTAKLVNDKIEFKLNQTFVIEKAGNPYVRAISGGLLVLYGTQKNGDWQTTAATFDGQKWSTRENKFLLSVPGQAVCDPHATDLPDGGSMISVSVAQNSTSFLYSSLTLTEFYQELTQ